MLAAAAAAKVATAATAVLLVLAAAASKAATASLAVYCRPATIASLKYHSVQVQINLFIYFTEVTTVYGYTSNVPYDRKISDKINITKLISAL